MTTVDAPPFVALSHVSKTYPGVRALHNVSLEFREGEVVGLLGKNGAGKSTLIKIMAGLVHPDAGETVCAGRPVRLDSPATASAHGLAFVHQELALVPGMTVAENISLGHGFPKTSMRTVSGPRLRARAREVLNRLRAPIDPAELVAHLSLAHQRLVMLARGLSQDARLVVLDEPTASMTDDEISHLFTVMADLRGKGVGMVYVSHRLDEIQQVTDRVVVMRDGLVVSHGRTAAVNRDWMVAAITGQAGHGGDAADRRRSRPLREIGPELLKVDHLETPLLRDVSLAAHEGEVLGLAGLVGAGRTELARVIFGIDRAHDGVVSVRGRQVPPGSPRKAMRAGVVLLPEDRRTQGNILTFSLRENVTLSSLPAHRHVGWLPVPGRGKEQETARHMVKDLSISSSGIDQSVASLSGGNQQKVVLARWLRHGAEVFLFDEPTHGVDVGGKGEIYAIMQRLAAQGKAVVFISSEFSELVEVCDRVLVMREGAVVGELVDDAVTEPAILHLCYS